MTQLTIKNYRSFNSETSIDLPSSHMVLVGGNNVGKSNVVKALDLVLGSRSPWRVRLEPDDFFDPTVPIELGVTIGQILDSDKQMLYPLCTNQQQRGALSSRTDLEISIKLTIPAWELAEVENEDDEQGEMPTKVDLEVKLWGFRVHRGGDNVRKALSRSVVVSPHRRVDFDLNASRWSPYGQLMKEVLESSSQFNDLRVLLGQVNEKVQAAFAEQKEELLEGARVVSYVDNIEFRLTEQGNPVELLRNLEIFVEESGHIANIDHVGTGTQSAVIIGMFELILQASSGRVRILCVEEPEAFIHPHGIRRLGRLLREATEESSVQVLLVSHSPSLLATLTPADVIRIEMENGQSKVYQSGGALSAPHFARFISPETAEMFFAKRVILVEGDTERFLLPPLAGLIQNGGKPLDLDRERISVIGMGSKDNVLNYLKILDAFSIDAWVILDSDFLGGSSLAPLLTYLQGLGTTIDRTDETTLRRDLLAQQIIVLSQGEIEDYIPDSDVAAASGETLSSVQTTLTSHSKRGSGFKAVFRTGKPQYAMTLADYYVSEGSVPAELERLIKLITS